LVNGKLTKIERKSAIENKDSSYESGRHWYTWKCFFPKNDTVIIDNSYTAVYGGSIDGTSEIRYIIGTAKSWNGPIKKGTIIFDHSRIASDLFRKEPYMDSLQRKQIHLKKYADSLVMAFDNYTPIDEEEVNFNIFSFWKFPEPSISDSSRDLYKGLRDLIKSEWKEEVDNGVKCRDIINEIYAREGYVFKDNKLQLNYERKNWYKADSLFTVDKLNNYELFLIAIIKELESDKKNAP
jgi:hypothetical protein